jgi:hypothetical protein
MNFGGACGIFSNFLLFSETLCELGANFADLATPEVPRTRLCPGPMGLAYGGAIRPAEGLIGFLCTLPNDILYFLHKKCRIPVHRAGAMQNIAYELRRTL